MSDETTNKQADTRSLDTWMCPIHQLVLRVGEPCPSCKEQQAGQDKQGA